MNILSGIAVKNVYKQKLLEETKRLVDQGCQPTLCLFQVGNNPVSNVYIAQKKKFGQDIGVNVNHIALDEHISFEEIKKEITELMVHLSSYSHKKFGVSSATETEQAYRYLICHAFINIFNKVRDGKIQDGKLLIDNDDLKVARNLIKMEVDTKNVMLQCMQNMDYYHIKTRETLKKWEESRRRRGLPEISKEAKFVMESNIRK